MKNDKELVAMMKGMEKMQALVERAKSLGFEVVDPNYMDISWLSLNIDDKETFEFMFEKVLKKNNGMTVWGMYDEVDVVPEGDTYRVTAYRTRGNVLLLKPEPLKSLEDLRDFLLIFFKGVDGIHDYGKLVES